MSPQGVTGTATVTKIRGRHAVVPVYNLTVQGTSRSLVGACGVVVHNTNGCGIPSNARHAQTTYSARFSKGGRFEGMTVDSLAAALRFGSVSPAQVPVNYIIRGGQAIILNTRSAKALEAAGIPRSQWNGVNRTGHPLFERLLNGQLMRNPGAPVDAVQRR